MDEDWAEREAQCRQWMETVCLPYWQRLAPAYAAALAEPLGQDSGRLQVHIEDWPEDFARQQQTLTQLLVTSKLCRSWRRLAQWQLAQRTLYTDGMRRVSAALEQEHRACDRPLPEIPLYWGFIRATCQELICLPVAQHQAQYNDSACYDPATVDEATGSGWPTVLHASSTPRPPYRTTIGRLPQPRWQHCLGHLARQPDQRRPQQPGHD